jgi:hypothetical protein
MCRTIAALLKDILLLRARTTMLRHMRQPVPTSLALVAAARMRTTPSFQGNPVVQALAAAAGVSRLCRL